ncbi:MAG: hypothetical protein QM695_01070 [Micropruina sp.]
MIAVGDSRAGGVDRLSEASSDFQIGWAGVLFAEGELVGGEPVIEPGRVGEPFEGRTVTVSEGSREAERELVVVQPEGLRVVAAGGSRGLRRHGHRTILDGSRSSFHVEWNLLRRFH